MTTELHRLLGRALGVLALAAPLSACDKGDTGKVATYDTVAISDAQSGDLVVVCDGASDVAADEASCLALGSEADDHFGAVLSESGLDVDELLDGPYWDVDAGCCAVVEVLEAEGETDEPEVGRPFLIGGGRRLARPVTAGAWSTGETPGPVAQELGDALAAGWRRAGLAEHASVAAFSRFSLVLMHLGAPPDLVADAHRAALDEVRHAEVCFRLASHYAGAEVGPGPLDVRGALEGELEPRRVLETLVAEGCIGETLAALEAAAAARQATDPVVVSVLEGIAADETRHAALAWRTLRWLVARYPELADALPELLAPPVGAASEAPGLPAHGMLSGADRQRIRAVAFREVVAPLLAQVIGGETEAAPTGRTDRPGQADSGLHGVVC